MSVSAKRALARSPQHFTETRIAAEIGANDQSVHEKSDQAFGLSPIASGDWRPDANVFLAGVAIEQCLEGRQQRHKRRGSFTLT
ncbi:MAG: hypothetical protein HONDAALG_02415 [Gammaproteobacteria bacterium]|nr:hypothetical protein [Gammaproteobacteria bacterium]